MIEACGVFSLNMFYVFIDVDCFVVNVDECLLCKWLVFWSLEVLCPKDHFWDWTSSWSQEQKS